MEIKFRGWDKELDFMISIEKYKINLNGQIFFDNDDKCLYNQTDKIILMQYTGLKDKNGVEIYDGDIIIDSGNFIYKILFDINESRFGALYKNKIYDLNKEEIKKVKVIGNIYENKELLN